MKSSEPEDKLKWNPMQLSYQGKVNQIILQGGGKNSPAPTDPGEARKVRPPRPEFR
jgi:hypothetical protein